MNNDFLVMGIFGGIAVTHYLIEEKFKAKHVNVHWLIPFLHPVTIEMLKDWIVHIVVYSKYAIIQLN